MDPADYFEDFYEAILTGRTNDAQNVIKSLLEYYNIVDAYRTISQAMYDFKQQIKANEKRRRKN